MKKNLTQKIFLGVIVVLMLLLGGEVYNEFMANHTYYNSMFASMNNWWLIIGAVVSAGLPVLYLVNNKKFSLKKFTIWLFLGLLLFSFIHVIVNDSFVSKGLLMYIINILILFGLGAYFLTGVLALGTRLSKFIKFKENRLHELFLKFGIGLGALLILVEILIGFGLFHPIVTWIIFLGLGFLIRYTKPEMKENGLLISESLSNLRKGDKKLNRWKWILICLVLFSIVYYFYGFQLSFIPYSTAWDANHAYMYGPKVIAENYGLLRGNIGEAGAMPYLWYMFITFWFSIGSIFSGGRLSPDTIAVAMNFLSGPLCLIFGIALISEIVSFFSEKTKISDTGKNISFATGWMILLLWLTSGMGAFLVFVDNKTDLGVMAITLLAILSGFVFIRYMENNKSKQMFDKESMKYLITSGVFFALAGMAKPSAFIDMVVFGLLLVALRINSTLSLGLGVIALGMMGILQPVNAADFMGPEFGTSLVIIGCIICIIGIIFMLIKNIKVFSEKKNSFAHIIIWGIALVATLLVFKGPWLAYKQISNHEFTIGEFGKGLFMSYNISDTKDNEKDNIVLLAQTMDIDTLQDQNDIDKAYLQENDEEVVEAIETIGASEPAKTINAKTVEQCLTTKYSDKELSEGTTKAEVTNEDVGRYVGYGRKDFGSNKNRLSFLVLKLFYPKNDTCYGVNKDAKILCENQKAIEDGDIEAIKKINLKEGTPAYELLTNGLAEYAENEDAKMDLLADLQTYYQNHSIYRENNHIYMPYRYIVPLNITFNWSLQNLSSYYTDIGFIWIFVFIITILSFIYASIKADRKLLALSISTIAGWAIWWTIGGGILWYGIGLLMWTILTVTTFALELINDQKDDNHNVLYFVTFGLLGLWMILQIFFNFIRISSQGSSGPFLWFKQSAGTEQNITSTLGVENNTKLFYGQKDVFDLQFPQYNQFIEYVKDRADEDGVLIAGTYLQYFLDNQKNLKLDGSLGWFREQGSDEDPCKMYHRLRNSNIKYLVIDPNIVSIVMGDGNKSLFYRYFAKINESGKIIQKGAMFMLTQLIQDGYAKLLYSNNVGATYAFTMSDDELISIFGNMSADDLIYLRAQLANARYMDNANELINAIAQIFTNRVANGQAISDIADVYGKIVDAQKIINAVNVYISSPQSLSTIVDTLTQDERYILLNYLQIYSMAQQTNNSQYSEVLNNILSTSLAGGSQLMIFELR